MSSRNSHWGHLHNSSPSLTRLWRRKRLLSFLYSCYPFCSSFKHLVFSKRAVWPKWPHSHRVIWKLCQSKLPVWLPKQCDLQMDNLCSKRPPSTAYPPDICIGNVFSSLDLHMWPRWSQGWKRWKFSPAGKVLWQEQAPSSAVVWAIHVGGIWQWSNKTRERISFKLHCCW